MKLKRRNLELFITDLLNKKNLRSKKQQTELELFNIKQTFLKHKYNLSTIQNAMIRLTYIAMMGHSIDFGLDQIISLVTSSKFNIIQSGWLAFVIFDIRDEISLKPILPILQQQLLSYDNEPLQCLALSVISQLFCKEILEVLGPEVAEIAVSPKTSEFSRKRALIIAGKIYQITHEPHLIEILAPALKVYIEYGSHSIRMATATLTVGLMSSQPGAFSDMFENVLEQLFQLHSNSIGIETSVINEEYEGTPSPWYSKQLIKILRFKASWSFEELSKIDAVAMALFSRTGEKLSIRPALSYFIVFSEMVSLLSMIPIPDHTTERCASTLVRYLESSRHYMIYFALDSLNHLFHTNPKISKSIKNCRPILYQLIHSDDTQVVINSLNLLVHFSTKENSKEIVEKLIEFLPISPIYIRDLVCTKISLLAKNTNDPVFYIDTIVELLYEVGEKCEDSTWQAAIQLIDSDTSLQAHTIDLTLNYMKKALRPSEQLMKLTVYIAGEYIFEKVNRIVSFITSRFSLQTPAVQAMMVTAIAKISSRFPAFLPKCQAFLKYCSGSENSEVSDRAKQYSMMIDIMPTVAPVLMKRMPPNMGEEELNQMLETVFEVANNEEGVSTFKLDDEETRFMLDTNDKLIENFILTDSGYIYHDIFLRVHLSITVNPPLISSIFSLENNGILPLTDIQLQIVTNGDIQSRSTPFPNFINSSSTANFQVEFLFVTITNMIPQLIVSFKCGGIENASNVLVPIFFSKIVKSALISPDVFQSKWLSISDKKLFSEISVPIVGEDPITEIEFMIRKQLGFEPIRLSQNQIVGCGMYRSQKSATALMTRFIFNPGKPDSVTVHLKATSENGLQVMIYQLLPAMMPPPEMNFVNQLVPQQPNMKDNSDSNECNDKIQEEEDDDFSSMSQSEDQNDD
ncbi:Adaptin N terminal region family protein [Tritrichomonas foetus]|uniref:AP-2 complex subunit alpha n=1 Tax=Tritrichomonas foetus TaxID=1144522 RepID=A0A1J4J2D6_9EUKA|nr:Adaptin N terminal region family protein [Tritrichomonas foetus]|eukprot:OHS92905.1 Adaptin N terminal region family protein [Tritrichomonas foetus]